MKFSANLGMLWTELSLPVAIRAAKLAGFSAVECHWPYDTPAIQVKQALSETGLSMLSLNTARGDSGQGEFGLSALPGREDAARAAIDQAVQYARQIQANNIHVMAGIAQGDAAQRTFIENLRYACNLAGSSGINILIEPINNIDVPGYFLTSSQQAVQIIDQLGAPNLRMMFDCYHLQIMQGDITRSLRQIMPVVGHIQIASVPDRAEPDGGELDYRYLMQQLQALGYQQPIGAEYRPRTTTEAGLGWLSVLG